MAEGILSAGWGTGTKQWPVTEILHLFFLGGGGGVLTPAVY